MIDVDRRRREGGTRAGRAERAGGQREGGNRDRGRAQGEIGEEGLLHIGPTGRLVLGRRERAPPPLGREDRGVVPPGVKRTSSFSRCKQITDLQG